MIDIRTIPDRWRRADVTVRDFPLALALMLGSLVPGLEEYGTRLGDLPSRPFDGLAVLVVLLECLPLAVRRRWPAVCVILVCTGFAIEHVVASPLPPAGGSQGTGQDLARGGEVPVTLMPTRQSSDIKVEVAV